MRTLRVGPLSLLAASLLPVAGATAIHTTRLGLTAVAVLLVLSPLLVRRWRATVRRAALGVAAGLSVAVSTWLYGGHDLDTAIGSALRILYIVLPGAMLTPSLDPSSLGDHLAQRLHLPARTVVAVTAALERLELLGEQWQQISRARRARSYAVRRASGYPAGHSPSFASPQAWCARKAIFEGR